ncbi:MAG: hypothetical protein ABIR71_09350 [Chthoniobacterales bacterium]
MKAPINEWPAEESDLPPRPHPLSVSSVSSVSSASSASSVGQLLPDILFEVGQAVEATAMTAPKTSRIQQFKFVRRIKAITLKNEVELTPMQHRVIYELWQARNCAFLSPQRDYFSEYLARLNAVLFAEGQNLTSAYERALIATPTARVMCYSNEAAHFLACLCRELQTRAGDQPFFLDCRNAGKMIGVHFTTANEWLNGFQQLGILKLVEKGEHGKSGKASRYLYIADD